jgi:hypothetical protein
MVLAIIQLLEVITYKHANELTLRDLKCVKDASNRIREHKDQLSKLDLEDLGGEEIYREIATEMKEWIFIYENEDVRKMRQRPARKSDTSYDAAYLSEAYEIVIKMYKQSLAGMKKLYPSLRADQVSLGMFREFLQTGKCTLQLVTPKHLVEKYELEFRSFNARIDELYSRLAGFRAQIERITLGVINDIGVTGIREKWSGSQLIMQRVHLEYFAIPEKENAFFRSSYRSKVNRNQAAGSDTDDERLYVYLKFINTFFCKMEASNDYEGIPEMQVALDAFLTQGS